MCGDVEDDAGRLDGDLLQRFLVRAQAMLEQAPAQGPDLHAYLDRLFADVLRRCVRDTDEPDAADAYRRMAMQSVVLARLAGFLAGHVALNEDPLRKVMEALMLGYAEAESVPARDHHGHDHDHGHGHDHGHAHGHGPAQRPRSASKTKSSRS